MILRGDISERRTTCAFFVSINESSTALAGSLLMSKKAKSKKQ
jgi:hypothetical protein